MSKALLKNAGDVMTVLSDLLTLSLSEDESRLLMVGVNGAEMANPRSETGRTLHDRCDRIGVAREAARKLILEEAAALQVLAYELEPARAHEPAVVLEVNFERTWSIVQGAARLSKLNVWTFAAAFPSGDTSFETATEAFDFWRKNKEGRPSNPYLVYLVPLD